MKELKKYDAELTCKVKIGNFSEIRSKLERMFEDAIIAVEQTAKPGGLPIKLSGHHVPDIVKAVDAYINELESAYLHGVFMCPDTGVKREAIEG